MNAIILNQFRRVRQDLHSDLVVHKPSPRVKKFLDTIGIPQGTREDGPAWQIPDIETTVLESIFKLLEEGEQFTYVITPVRIKYIPSRLHSVDVTERMRANGGTIDVTRNIESIFGFSYQDVQAKALGVLTKWIKERLLASFPGTTLADFSVDMACEEIKDGRCWTTGAAIQSLTFKAL